MLQLKEFEDREEKQKKLHDAMFNCLDNQQNNGKDL